MIMLHNTSLRFGNAMNCNIFALTERFTLINFQHYIFIMLLFWILSWDL